METRELFTFEEHRVIMIYLEKLWSDFVDNHYIPKEGTKTIVEHEISVRDFLWCLIQEESAEAMMTISQACSMLERRKHQACLYEGRNKEL